MPAIAREKSLKRWRREWKYRIIEQMNPEWRNLFNPQTGEIDFGSSDVGSSDERDVVQEQ
jgi:putative endonuclease